MQHYYNTVEGFFTFPNLYATAVLKNSKGIFVEVGSWFGQSSVFLAVEIINSNKPIKLHCVDTWRGSEEHQDDARVIEDTVYEKFISNIAPVKEVIVPVRKASVEASTGYEDQSIDFVFIDAAHDYDNVKADIAAWYPKVRPGGVLAGHDYGWEGVNRAVNEFLELHQYPLSYNSELCWALRKRKV